MPSPFLPLPSAAGDRALVLEDRVGAVVRPVAAGEARAHLLLPLRDALDVLAVLPVHERGRGLARPARLAAVLLGVALAVVAGLVEGELAVGDEAVVDQAAVAVRVVPVAVVGAGLRLVYA